MSKNDKKPEKNFLTEDCDKIGEIAVHYGFSVVKTLSIHTSIASLAKPFKEFDYYSDVEEKIALTKWYMEELTSLPQPIMIHYKKPLLGSVVKKKPTEEMYGFEIMGSSKPESEALILKATLAVLHDLGYDNLCVDINSIGDKESVSKFERELNTYFRKHSHELPAKVKEAFKKNHYSIVNGNLSGIEELHNIPQSMSSLSDLSRCHFKEVLEYMEVFDIVYKIKPSLLPNKLYGSHTIFEIRQTPTGKETEGTLLAHGYRYNHLAKKIGAKKDVPCIGMTLTVKKSAVPLKKVVIKNIKKPRFYLVQLGTTAKLKALNVVEMLRIEKIPVYHSLTKDKITGQLTGAEYMKATHVLIIGQKEAIENSIVVRHVITREQETIALHELVEFLRALK